MVSSLADFVRAHRLDYVPARALPACRLQRDLDLLGRSDRDGPEWLE